MNRPATGRWPSRRTARSQSRSQTNLGGVRVVEGCACVHQGSGMVGNPDSSKANTMASDAAPIAVTRSRTPPASSLGEHSTQVPFLKR